MDTPVAFLKKYESFDIYRFGAGSCQKRSDGCRTILRKPHEFKVRSTESFHGEIQHDSVSRQREPPRRRRYKLADDMSFSVLGTRLLDIRLAQSSERGNLV